MHIHPQIRRTNHSNERDHSVPPNGRRHLFQGNRPLLHLRQGGSKQKYYLCSGKGGGCPVEVKAYKGRGGWNITGLVDGYTNCSGGMAKGKGTALHGMAADAMRDNPQLTGVAFKRKLERTGLKVTDRTATRLEKNAKKAHHAAVAGSYQQLLSLCAQLEKNSPGTVP
ncbi:unnamed protein product [Pylaiella littoralis]